MRRLQGQEPHHSDLLNKLNILRAGVLGANDGIVSTAGIVIGVAGATANNMTILASGLAGLLAGALSMAGGEYVSVSAQRDTERAAIKQEVHELKTDYAGELDELAEIYHQKGLSEKLARQVAIELMHKDALAAHAEAELHISPRHYVSPCKATLSSLFAFISGALLPLLFITLLPESIKIVGTFIAVLIALIVTGFVSAYLGNIPWKANILRNTVVGMITMLVTYTVGNIFPI